MGTDDNMDAERPTKDVLVQEIGTEARQATEIEHSLTFFEGLKLYPTAVGWTIFFSLGIIMTAFDPQLLGSLYATPAFQKDFGYEYQGSYIIAAPWQSGLSMGSPIGQVVGALAAGYPMEWYGRKKVEPSLASTRQPLTHFFPSRRSLPASSQQRAASSSNSSRDPFPSFLLANFSADWFSVLMPSSPQHTPQKSVQSPFVVS